jgi:rhamnosyltransferase subunit B
MRFLFAVQGSFGDINPCAGIGAGLRERGHEVVFLTSGYYQKWLAGLGIETVPTLSLEEEQRRIAHPHFSHPVRSYRLLWDSLLLAGRREYEAIRERFEPGRTVVITRLWNVGPRLAAEKLGVRSLHVAVSPDELGLSPSPGVRGKLRAWVVRRFDRRIRGGLNRLRRELELLPVARWLSAENYLPESILGLFPQWYAPPAPGWPRIQYAGFPLFDGGTSPQLTERLEEFLAKGDAPIIITTSSTTEAARKYFQIAVSAVEKIGARAVLLSSFSGNVPAQLPASIGYFGYVPLRLLLPRSAAIVHHGGVGTVAAALRAGIPQLIVPVKFDNEAHGARVSNMGVGSVLRLRQLQPERLAKEVQPLLASLRIREKCYHYAEKLRGADGIEAACRIIEDDSREFSSSKTLPA